MESERECESVEKKLVQPRNSTTRAATDPRCKAEASTAKIRFAWLFKLSRFLTKASEPREVTKKAQLPLGKILHNYFNASCAAGCISAVLAIYPRCSRVSS